MSVADLSLRLLVDHAERWEQSLAPRHTLRSLPRERLYRRIAYCQRKLDEVAARPSLSAPAWMPRIDDDVRRHVCRWLSDRQADAAAELAARAVREAVGL